MFRQIVFSSLILLTGLLTQAASAQDVVLELDPSRSTVDFTLGAFLHTVHGSFRFKSGAIRLDPATGKAQGEIDVDLTTGSTGNGARDAVMQGHVLESQRFPDAVFTADAVSGQVNAAGPSTFELHGRLAIHGANHDWTFHVTAEANGTQVTVTSHAVIPYVQWGMKNPSTFFLRVNDQVDVNVRAIATYK